MNDELYVDNNRSMIQSPEATQTIASTKHTQTIASTKQVKSTETFHHQAVNKMTQTPVEGLFFTPASKYLQRILQSERTFRSVCGITRKFFQLSVIKVGPKLLSRVLSPDEQVALFWKKLKQNVSFISLAADFDINERSASKIFQNVLTLQFEHAKKGIWWLSRTEIDATMPESFKAHYPKTRVIIDATEIKIQTPSDVAASVLTWSSYKHHHTLKFLVGIAPGGMIMFVSKAYGGRVTDVHLTTDCGVLDLLEEGDLVIVDKGFPHIEEDIVNRRAFLVMPPFKQGIRQFSSSENDACYKIASLRIHVERAIQRMKIFSILTFLESSLISSIDKIIVVIAQSVNHFPPLIQEKSEDANAVENTKHECN